jgi:crotonobetainyl-CoA:carnitine CoA-transferase CaiB-like acyl-CoA transferase
MLSDSPEIETNPAPGLGQHTKNILSEVLQYSDEKIDKLTESGTIGINSKI